MYNKPEHIGFERFMLFLEEFGYGTEDQLKYLGKEYIFNGNRISKIDLVDS